MKIKVYSKETGERLKDIEIDADKTNLIIETSDDEISEIMITREKENER